MAGEAEVLCFLNEARVRKGEYNVAHYVVKGPWACKSASLVCVCFFFWRGGCEGCEVWSCLNLLAGVFF